MKLARLVLFFLLSSAVFPALADTDIWLRLQGSNTIGARLAPAWAKAFLEKLGVTQVSIKPGAAENEFIVSGVQLQKADGSKRSVGISVAAHGSATGFQALQETQADIAMASRPIKSEERDKLAAAGDMESPAAEHAVAIDGVAILIHPGNPVAHLYREQIARLFSGEIRNWRELGGPDRPVTIYARDERSGTWETFKELVLGKTFALSAGAQRFESSDKLSDAVANDPGAIGFSGLASIRSSKAIAVADGDALALRPEHFNIATEDYALSRRLFLYTPPNRQKPLIQAFVEFCQSEEGQQIVAKTGFVSQNIAVVHQPTFWNAPAGYQALATNMDRLSVNFRFKQGNTLLDNKAQRDLDRLCDFLSRPENRQRRVYLVGFSDTNKTEHRDQVISRFRALTVRAALMRREVPVFDIQGFGAFMPVATNAEVAAAKNGRVEVWLAPPTVLAAAGSSRTIR